MTAQTLPRRLFTLAAGASALQWLYDRSFGPLRYVVKVSGPSMQPVLNPGLRDVKDDINDDNVNEVNNVSKDVGSLRQDRVLRRHILTGSDFDAIRRGDIVIFASPTDSLAGRKGEKLRIKRVVALPGDRVTTRHYKKRHLTIPPGHCWIEGDNHLDSIDSNDFGPLPLGLVRSKALAVVWPRERWRWLKHEIDADEYEGRVKPLQEAIEVE